MVSLEMSHQQSSLNLTLFVIFFSLNTLQSQSMIRINPSMQCGLEQQLGMHNVGFFEMSNTLIFSSSFWLIALCQYKYMHIFLPL